MSSTAVLDDLEAFIREHHPELVTERSEDGTTLRITERTEEADPKRPSFILHARRSAVVLDWTWRFPVSDGTGLDPKDEALRAKVLAYVSDGIENHGWDVPIVLAGGPLAGRRMTKRRQDLVGRLMFARQAKGPDDANRAHLYKWHLRKSAEDEYVCRYERTLEGSEVDEFFARGPDRTGSFVVIHDTE